MLVLSRKPLQSIMIGPDIKITIVKLERNQVRIGIEAPRDVAILRSELADISAEGHSHVEAAGGARPVTEVEVLAV